MKPSKILSAGIVLVLAFCLAGCGTAQKKEEMKALEKNVREVENFLKNSMKEFEVLDFGKEGKVHWTNTKTGRMFRNLIKK